MSDDTEQVGHVHWQRDDDDAQAALAVQLVKIRRELREATERLQAAEAQLVAKDNMLAVVREERRIAEALVHQLTTELDHERRSR